MKSPHLDRDWLTQKYLVEKLSTYDIAAIVGRDPKRIYEKLRDFNIPTRPRGENLRGDDNFMKSSPVHPMLGKRMSPEARAKLSIATSVPKPYLRGKNNGMFGRTGSKNPRYVDGSSPERQRMYVRGEGREFLREVLKRDAYSCQRCGARKIGPKSLHVHHIKPWAGNPSLRFDKSNVVVLCRACHGWVHSRDNVNREYLA